MAVETYHQHKMDDRYNITNINIEEPATAAKYRYKSHIVDLKESITDTNSFKDRWDNDLVVADLTLMIDGKQIETLKDYPVRKDEKGLNRYHDEVAYLIVEDNKTKHASFVVILNKTKKLKPNSNGILDRRVPLEEHQYTIYTLDDKGNLLDASFSFNNRDKLQTELLNVSGLAPHTVGYYTDARDMYPSYYYPITFPFLTLIIGLALIVNYSPMRKKFRANTI
jgi:hypothetical protein